MSRYDLGLASGVCACPYFTLISGCALKFKIRKIAKAQTPWNGVYLSGVSAFDSHYTPFCPYQLSFLHLFPMRSHVSTCHIEERVNIQ